MKKIMLLFLLILLVTGCGNNPDGNEPEENMPSQPLPDASNQQGGEITPDLKEAPATEPNEEESEPKEIEKTYHMNKIYDIVPNDPEGIKKVVLLTFDDGPKEEEMITKMLEILDKHNAKAIFFVNGYLVKSKPELLKQLHDAGHMIGNHSWDHIPLNEQTNEKIDQQIEDVQNYVEELIGEKPNFFRPPHGAGNDYVRKKVMREEMLYMTWSAAAEDWLDEYRTTEAIVKHVMEQLRPGSNILLHELAWTVDALDTLLTRITEEGYSFVDPRAIEIESPTLTTPP